MKFEEIIGELKSKANPKNVEGMERFGIKSKNKLGILMSDLRGIAKKIGKNHQLALKLWDSDIHEAQILAGFIDDPKMVTGKQMEKWVSDFDSWGVCDAICGHLFDRTKFAYKKSLEWTKRDGEYAKRAGFVIMAWGAVHNKKDDDKIFIDFLKVIKRESTDGRIYVKKAVNWSLREIGKARNKNLYNAALKTAYEIREIDNKTAKWIANDAIRELESKKIKSKFK